MSNIKLSIVYQAKINLNNEKIHGYEVLARFFDGNKQLNTECVINTLSSIEEKRTLTSEVISILLNEISIVNTYNYKYSVNISSSEVEDIYFKRWIDNLKYLKKLNFSIALDDVGVGYNTLDLIDNLTHYIDLDYIKLDRSIVNTIHDFNIVEYMLNIIHSKGIQVIAEGVEDIVTYVKLKELNCDFAQGYFIHKPSSLYE